MTNINDLPEDVYQAFEKKFNEYAYMRCTYAEVILCAEHFFVAGYEAAIAKEKERMMLPNKITIVRIQSADNLTFAEMSLDQFYERVSNEMKPVIRIPVAQSIRYSARLDNVDSIDETDRVFFKRYEHAKRQFAGIDGSFDVLMIIYQEKIQAKQENNKGWLRI